MAAQLVLSQKVVGSSPISPTIFECTAGCGRGLGSFSCLVRRQGIRPF